MKKILAKLAQTDSDDGVNTYNNFGGGSSSQHASFIGRQYHVGHFTLVVEDTIAEGGFGTVFRVRSQQGQHYALKRTYVNNNQDLAVCKREITIVSSLSHKNILRYIDSRINRLPQGVFEVLLLTVFYPASLSQFLQERKQAQQRLTEVEVLRVFCDLCEAVCRLHHCKTPVIHRDLKVENVLIDERNNFVLCDFGSATSRVLLPSVHGLVRCKEEIERYTTLAYRAPEVIDLYKNVPLGPQIDIWAMGCLLYCLCFATLPFGESALAIESGNYSLPDSSPYSERLHKLIGYLLCVNAYKRPDIYQTCALAFSLSGRPNPSQNLSNLPIPRWQDLIIPPRESQLKLTPTRTDRCDSHNRSSNVEHTTSRTPIDDIISDRTSNTSVVPRQRPRATSANPTSIQSGQPRPLGTEGVTVKMPTPVVIKPPPPPPSSSDHVSELPSVSRSRNCPTFGDFPTDSSNSTEVIDWDKKAKGGWEANFSGPDESTSTVGLQPAVLFRGHQRTWSVDVAYINRLNVTQPRPSIAEWPGAEESASQSNDHGTSLSYEPFSSAVRLRQVQSLAALPTSALPTAATRFTTSIKPITSARPDITFDQKKSPEGFGLFDRSAGNISSSDLCPLRSDWPSLPKTIATPTIDEDTLFGAAFDAIRRGGAVDNGAALQSVKSSMTTVLKKPDIDRSGWLV